MGDVIHCLPLAARIKKRLPGVELTWLVEPAAADLLRNNPVLDKVLVFPRKEWLKGLSRLTPSPDAANNGTIFNTFGTARKYFAELKESKFDLAIDAQGLLKSAIPAYLSGAPLRVGFAGTREGAEQLLTHRLEVDDYFNPNRHVVELNMALADYALEILAQQTGACLRLTGRDHTAIFPLPDPPKSAVDKVSQRLAQLTSSRSAGVTNGVGPAEPVVVPESISDGPPEVAEAPDSKLVSKMEAPPVAPPSNRLPAPPVIALIPGTTWITKIWPEQYWIDLGCLLIERFGARLVICGGPADATINQSIYKGIASANSGAFAKSVVDLTGETNLIELVALFEKCDVVVGGDTGPLHLAAAVANGAAAADTVAKGDAANGNVVNGAPAQVTVANGADANDENCGASERALKVVAIHGATPWLRNGPYGDMCTTVHLNLECQPCFEKTCRIKTLACLKDLPVEEVFKTVERMWIESRTAK